MKGKVKTMLYMNQLPPQVRAEAKRDFYRILCTEGCVDHFSTEEQTEIIETIENSAMCSKVRDVVGCEDEGLLDFAKYERWVI